MQKVYIKNNLGSIVEAVGSYLWCCYSRFLLIYVTRYSFIVVFNIFACKNEICFVPKMTISWWFIDLAKYVTRCVKTSLKVRGAIEKENLKSFQIASQVLISDDLSKWQPPNLKTSATTKKLYCSFHSVKFTFELIQRFGLSFIVLGYAIRFA